MQNTLTEILFAVWTGSRGIQTQTRLAHKWDTWTHSWLLVMGKKLQPHSKLKWAYGPVSTSWPHFCLGSISKKKKRFSVKKIINIYYPFTFSWNDILNPKKLPGFIEYNLCLRTLDLPWKLQKQQKGRNDRRNVSTGSFALDVMLLFTDLIQASL